MKMYSIFTFFSYLQQLAQIWTKNWPRKLTKETKEVFSKYELQVLLNKYDITGICSPYHFTFLAHN